MFGSQSPALHSPIFLQDVRADRSCLTQVTPCRAYSSTTAKLFRSRLDLLPNSKNPFQTSLVAVIMYGDWQLSGVYLIFNFYGDLEILLSENGLDIFFSFKRLKKAHSQSTWDNKDFEKGHFTI